MTRDRLLGVTARLLAVAAALVEVGVVLVIHSGWQQLGQAFGPDGTATSADVPVAHRATLLVFESGYRPIGVPLLLASVLVLGAVVALHRYPSWEHVRRLRWEVLGAGLLALVTAVGLVLLNLYVLTTPDGPAGDMADYVGPQPLTGPIVGNLTTLVATLLIITLATLWWLRLAPAPVSEVDDAEPVEQEPEAAAHDPAPGPDTRDGSTSLGVESRTDHSRDWSPEDFRPPR